MTPRAERRPFRSVFCVGLDGATFDIIDPLIAKGKLPALQSLLTSGARAPLASTVPPLSAPAWVSFMTGVNPGRHGVFHFRAMEEGTLGAGLVGSWGYRGRTIFDYASRAGLEVTSFRVPMTYPPWPLNGVMVSGFPTPNPRGNYSMPEEVGEGIGPLVKLSPVRAVTANLEAQIENIDYYLNRSTEALLDLISKRDSDLFCYVNSATDWIAHKFWRYSDPTAPGYEPWDAEGGTLLESFYEKTDASLGRLLEAAPADSLVIVLSDHGTGPRTENRFNTNAWLEGLGLWVRSQRRGVSKTDLKAGALQWVKQVVPGKTSLKPWLWEKFPALRPVLRSSAQGLRDYGGAMDCARSKTYRMTLHDHVEGVNVNLAGREPNGIVDSTEFESIRSEIIAAAHSLTDPATERKVFDGVYKREELYEGEHAHLAPDVILILNPRFEFGQGSGRKGVFSHVPASRLGYSSATHRPDGILAMAGPKVIPGELSDIRLIDVPATIMWALGLHVPKEMDGRVLSEAFCSELLEAFPVTEGESATTESEKSAFTPDEEKQMTKHLQELGYL